MNGLPVFVSPDLHKPDFFGDDGPSLPLCVYWAKAELCLDVEHGSLRLWLSQVDRESFAVMHPSQAAQKPLSVRTATSRWNLASADD